MARGERRSTDHFSSSKVSALPWNRLFCVVFSTGLSWGEALIPRRLRTRTHGIDYRFLSMRFVVHDVFFAMPCSMVNVFLRRSSLRATKTKGQTNPFALFVKDCMASVCGLERGQRMKELGRLWKLLSDGEKERYRDEARAVRETVSIEERRSSWSERSMYRAQKEESSRKALLRSAAPRPPNAYQAFTAPRLRGVARADIPSTMQKLAKDWRAMPAWQKEPLLEAARLEQAEYREKLSRWKKELFETNAEVFAALFPKDLEKLRQKAEKDLKAAESASKRVEKTWDVGRDVVSVSSNVAIKTHAWYICFCACTCISCTHAVSEHSVFGES